MNQKDFWNSKWSTIDCKLPPTLYAKRVNSFLKNKNCKTLLDLGCGDGKDSFYFAKNNFKVTAIDFSKSAIAIINKEITTKKIKNINTAIKNIKKLKLNKKFDIIYANLSLHYFNDKETRTIINHLKHILNKNGYLFIRVKSTDDPLIKIGIKQNANFYKIKGKNQHFFSKEYLKDILQDYNVIRIRKTSSKLLSIVNKKFVRSNFIESISQKK